MAAALGGLIVSLPVLAAAAIAIKLEDRAPVLFRQTRIGRHGVPFQLWKLRSMTPGRRGATITAAGDARVTRIGRFLRKYKLDEIPQLWNVLRGDMSLVGPRPELALYVDRSDARWQEILEFRPGITDLATLLHRDEEKILGGAENPEQFYRQSILPAKLSLSAQYMRQSSAWQDLKLILWTIRLSVWPSPIDRQRLVDEFLPAPEPRRGT
jgi:lipopolysaccharide/colanic/teichoic acid biosynthesis glycosyltransferase